MTVNVLIISHHDIGNALIQTVKATLGKNELPLPTHIVSVLPNTNPEQMIAQLKKQLAAKINQGILILTDIFGATPNNIAREIQNDNIRIVAGLNLPMLLRVMNYAQLNTQVSLTQLAKSAIQAGQEGILECEGTTADHSK